MALINCKECNKQIASDVKQCPHCGSSKHRSFFSKHPIVSVVGGLFLLGSIGNAFNDPSASSSSSNTNKESSIKYPPPSTNNAVEVSSNSSESKVEASVPSKNWIYDSSEDQMRGQKSFYAGNESTNSVDLEFPYNNSTMSILFREDKEFDILLKVKGQFHCNSYSETCYVNIKADDKPIKKFTYVESDSGNSNTVFIKNSKELYDLIKISNKLIIEAPLFRGGRVQYNFDVAGFDENLFKSVK